MSSFISTQLIEDLNSEIKKELRLRLANFMFKLDELTVLNYMNGFAASFPPGYSAAEPLQHEPSLEEEFERTVRGGRRGRRNRCSSMVAPHSPAA